MREAGNLEHSSLAVTPRIELRAFSKTEFRRPKKTKKVVSVRINPTSVKIVGTGFAMLHLIAFMIFVGYLHQSNEGQAILLWTLWMPVDFPISLTIPIGFDLLSSDSGIGSTLRRALPYFVHGVLGTVWWYYLPILVTTVFKKIIRTSRQSPR